MYDAAMTQDSASIIRTVATRYVTATMDGTKRRGLASLIMKKAVS